MTSAADVKAGRAGVEMYMDLSELNQGINQAQQSLKNMDKNISAQKWGVIGNAAGVGLQDFVTVLSNGGTLGSAIGAISNNVIQIASMVNPLAGGYTAVGIAAFQAAYAGYKMVTAAKQTKEELEKARKEAEGLAKAKREAAAKAGEEAAKLRADSKDPKAMDRAKEKAQDDLVAARGRENGLREEVGRLRGSVDDPEKEKQRKIDLAAAEKAHAEAVRERIKAEEQVIVVNRTAEEGAKTQAEKDAEQAHRRADLLQAKVDAPHPAGTWTPEQRKKEIEEAKAARAQADEMTREAKRRKDYKPETGSLAQAEKNSHDERMRASAEEQQEQEAADAARKKRIEDMRKELRTPSEVAADDRKEAQAMYDNGDLREDEYQRRLAQIDQERKRAMRGLLPTGAQEDEELAEDIKKNWMTPEERRKERRDAIDRLYGKNLLSEEEKQRALNSLDESKQSVLGTFSSAALGGLSASSPLDAIKENTAQTAEATKQLVKSAGPRKWEI